MSLDSKEKTKKKQQPREPNQIQPVWDQREPGQSGIWKVNFLPHVVKPFPSADKRNGLSFLVDIP